MIQHYRAHNLCAKKKYRVVRRYQFLSLLFSLLAGYAYGAGDNNSLSLSTAVERTLQQNPSLKVFQFRETALIGRSATVKQRPAFELDVEAENFAGSGELKGVDSAEFVVALSSVIEMGGKRSSRIGLVSQERLVLQAQMQVESLALLGEVTRRYIDVLAAQEKLHLAAEAAELASNTLSIVQKRAQAGATPDAEVKRAKAATAQARLARQASEQQLNYLRVSLSALWGERTPTFSVISGNLFYFGQDIALDTLYAKVINNPSIHLFAAQARLNEAAVRLAKTESSADISWSAGFKRSQESNDTALVAGFSMPLFSSKRNGGAISTALAEGAQIEVRREAALINLHTQLYRAFYNRKQAVATSTTLRNTIIPALKQALHETELAYQRGRYSYLEYVSARQELLGARRAQIEAAAAALSYGAEIEELTAEPLSTSFFVEKNNM